MRFEGVAGLHAGFRPPAGSVDRNDDLGRIRHARRTGRGNGIRSCGRRVNRTSAIQCNMTATSQGRGRCILCRPGKPHALPRRNIGCARSDAGCGSLGPCRNTEKSYYPN